MRFYFGTTLGKSVKHTLYNSLYYSLEHAQGKLAKYYCFVGGSYIFTKSAAGNTKTLL